MNKEDLLQLYERRYFYELELKEKLNGRVQGTFFLVTAVVTVAAYMIRMMDYSSSKWSIAAFYLCIIVMSALLGRSVYFFYGAMWGNTYQALPLPDNTDRYLKSLETYKVQIDQFNEDNPENTVPVVDIDKDMSDFLYESYMECVTHNAAQNMARSDKSLKAIRWLFSSAVPLALACLLFISLDMDVSSTRKSIASQDQYIERLVHSIVQINSNLHKENDMSQPAPPSPPTKPDPVPFTDSPVVPKDLISNGVSDVK